MKSPFVSVIVIGYNIEKYIDNCIQTVIDQSYRNIEIIFVNDGSKDNTLDQVKEYTYDSRLKIVDKPNGGIVSARKAGVRESAGDYVAFIDGDDWLNTDMIQKLVDIVEESTEIVDIVSSDMYRQEADGEFYIQKNEKGISSCSGDEYFELIMQDRVNHHMFPKLFRRQFVLDAGYLDYPEVTMAEDLMTNCFFGVHKPAVMFADSVNYFYRYNESSVMRSGNNTLLRQIQTLENMEDYLKKNSHNAQSWMLMEYQWISYVYTYMHTPLAHNIKKEIMTHCREKIRNYRDNQYSRKLFEKYPWHINILFYVYYNAPMIAGGVDSCLLWLKERKRRG